MEELQATMNIETMILGLPQAKPALPIELLATGVCKTGCLSPLLIQQVVIVVVVT